MLHLNRRVMLLAAPLLVLVLAACGRDILTPQGGSGGAVFDQNLVIGTREGELISLNYTGEEPALQWRFELRGEESQRAIYGTPVVQNGTVFAGGYDGILYAVSADQGQLLWQEPVGGAIVGGPTAVDGMVLVGSSDNNLYAVNTATQTVEWSFPTEGKVWTSPVVVEGVVYFGSLDHKVYAVSLQDGSKVWEFSTGGAIYNSLTVAQGRVLVGSFDGTFYALDAATGELQWQFDDASNWYWARPAVGESAVYAPSLDGNLYALDIASGQLRWTLETEGAITGAPAIVGEFVVVPSNDGKVRIVRRGDGVELDACSINADIMTPLSDAQDHVFFGAQDHSIRALLVKPNGNPDELWVYFTNRDDPIPRGRAIAC